MSHFETLKSVYPLSPIAYERLELFVARLQEWQKKTNLVAPSTLDDIWNRHVGDSLQCLAIKSDAHHWLDLGSGGGFPGLVIAAVMADAPEATVTLVESNHKKTAFLRQVNRQMGASATIKTDRIEEVVLEGPAPQVVTARALTSMANLLQLSHEWLEEGAVGLFHKGREFEAELAECIGLWRYDLVKYPSRISPESVVLQITNLMRDTGSKL